MWRQPFPGPGLAIRILCAEKPFMDNSFGVTNTMLHWLLNFGNKDQQTLLQEGISAEAKERIVSLVQNLGVEDPLKAITNVSATLVPIQTVGVQGDGRSYSYLVALSGTRNWTNLFFLAKLIPKVGYYNYSC